MPYNYGINLLIGEVVITNDFYLQRLQLSFGFSERCCCHSLTWVMPNTSSASEKGWVIVSSKCNWMNGDGLKKSFLYSNPDQTHWFLFFSHFGFTEAKNIRPEASSCQYTFEEMTSDPKPNLPPSCFLLFLSSDEHISWTLVHSTLLHMTNQYSKWNATSTLQVTKSGAQKYSFEDL